MNNNIDIFKKGLLEYAMKIEQRIISVLDTTANIILQNIENNSSMPWDTGNLKDSTGVGVYYKGTLVKYKPRQVAYQPQSTNNESFIWGTKKLEEALIMGQTTLTKGIWIVIYTAVPYAYELNYSDDQNNPHTGFFDDIVIEEFVETIFKNLTQI